jgi:hypothetical protein
MRPFPEPPIVPEDQRITTSAAPRYSDIAQDGRLTVVGIAQSIGPGIWQPLIHGGPIGHAIAAQGALPIMTRLLVEGGGGPLAARDPLELHGCYRLAHTVDAAGAVDRLILGFWLSAYGRRGRMYGPPPPGAGERVLAGRAFVEHVFTRPFAPPSERKVLRFEIPGHPPVPPDRYAWRAPEELLDLPEGAEPLDAEPAPDPAPIAFGLDHTDANQHVNSLAYPQIFQDAALRRLAAHGRPTALLCRRVEIGYRKPCFAGDRMRVVLRAFSLGGAFGAALALVPDGAEGRPHAWAQVLLGP